MVLFRYSLSITRKIFLNIFIQRVHAINHEYTKPNQADTDVRGEMQASGCLKALRKLESQGHFDLPKAQRKGRRNIPRRLAKSAPLPVDVPGEVNAIKAPELVMVQTTKQMCIWNELMIAEHYLDTAALIGRQIRYLICSEQGWLGGIGFAAAPEGLPLGILKAQCTASQK